MINKIVLFFCCSLSFAALCPVYGQSVPDSARVDLWNLHFQQTIITQYKPPMRALYSSLLANGGKSFAQGEANATSLTSTLFAGFRLGKDAAFYFNPEIAGGLGLSGVSGVAGFPNGETYRVGNSTPTVTVARAYLTQVFNLSSPKTVKEEDAPNQLAGNHSDHFIQATIGRFSLADAFDANQYSHDPRTQFFNWSLMSAGAWDYPADVRGYTLAAMIEYNRPKWSLRYAISLEPTEANGPELDWNIGKSNGQTLEYEQRYALHGRAGAVRLLGFFNRSRMASYREETEQVLESPKTDHPLLHVYSKNKAGFDLNAEQALGEGFGVFGRLSWNDGRNETWAFTEIDQSLSVGAVWEGARWKRPGDGLGAAVVVNGISDDHRAFLAAGGYGFIIGDGKLTYGNEVILELYYKCKVWKDNFWLTPDYQFILNPAYNQDRGPANVFGIRAHAEF